MYYISKIYYKDMSQIYNMKYIGNISHYTRCGKKIVLGKTKTMCKLVNGLVLTSNIMFYRFLLKVISCQKVRYWGFCRTFKQTNILLFWTWKFDFCWSSRLPYTPFENAQRWMGKNTFPILLLNDDNMIGEHEKTRIEMPNTGRTVNDVVFLRMLQVQHA